MDLEVKINKEIRDYQEAVFFGLTTRQFICSLLAIVVAIGLYFLTKNIAGREAFSWFCIVAAAPFAVAGFFKYNGMTIERFAVALITTLICSNVRVYKSENYYLEMLKTVENRRKNKRDKDA